MARRATLRASDSDRERIAERLREATAEGRLLAHELEERLEATFAARTYGELDAVVADLPSVPVRRREAPGRAGPSFWLRPTPILALFILAPVVLSLLLAVAVVIATVFSAWGLLLIVGWLAFGHGRRYYWGPYRRSLHTASQWSAGRVARPRSWFPPGM
jgi:Flp pilus assembly protein TadB